MNTSVLDRKERSATVTANAKAAEERRRAIAATFRAGLVAEIGGRIESVSQAARIDAAVSAHVEIAELSSLFLRCKASIPQQRQLALARGQLSRLLTSLGVGVVTAEPEDATPSETARTWLERAGDAPVSNPSDSTSGAD